MTLKKLLLTAGYRKVSKGKIRRGDMILFIMRENTVEEAIGMIGYTINDKSRIYHVYRKKSIIRSK